MNQQGFWMYLLLMAGSTYLIRALPFAVVKQKLKNRWIQSFLYYIPYAVLTAMTIPAVFDATNSRISAAVGLAAAVLVARKEKSLTVVAVVACVAVFLVELVLP